MGRKAAPGTHEIADFGSDLIEGPLSHALRTRLGNLQRPGKCHIRTHVPYNIVGRMKADFHFRLNSWQPSRSCLLTAERLQGTIRLFPVVCCVAIPPLAEPPRDF